MDRAEAERLIPKSAGTQRDARVSLSPGQLDTYERAVKRLVDDPAMRALMLLLPRTGLRIAEMTKLRAKNVITVPGGVALKFRGKGDKERTVRLTRKAATILQSGLRGLHRTAADYLFPNLRGTGPISSKRVQDVCRTITEVEPTLRGLTPHVLRHTYATMALLNCRDLKRLGDDLGHGKPTKRKVAAVTLVYLHPDALA